MQFGGEQIRRAAAAVQRNIVETDGGVVSGGEEEPDPVAQKGHSPDLGEARIQEEDLTLRRCGREVQAVFHSVVQIHRRRGSILVEIESTEDLHLMLTNGQGIEGMGGGDEGLDVAVQGDGGSGRVALNDEGGVAGRNLDGVGRGETAIGGLEAKQIGSGNVGRGPGGGEIRGIGERPRWPRLQLFS